MAKNSTKAATDEDDEDPKGAAGSESDEDDEDPKGAAGAESDEDDEDDDDEDAVLATLTPAQAKLFTSVTEKLTKANASARNRRLALQALRKGQTATGAKTGPPKPNAPKVGEGKPGAPAAFDPEAFKAELIAAFKGEQDAGKAQSTAEKALKRAGLILPDDEDAADRKIQRVMRMLDLDGVALDEIADEVEDLKADNPELFGKVKKKRPAAGGVGGPARVAGTKASSRLDDLFD
jgi:hypothetical protein